MTTRQNYSAIWICSSLIFISFSFNIAVSISMVVALSALSISELSRIYVTWGFEHEVLVGMALPTKTIAPVLKQCQPTSNWAPTIEFTVLSYVIISLVMFMSCGIQFGIKGLFFCLSVQIFIAGVAFTEPLRIRCSDQSCL
jgi:hypothetical protein